MKNFIGKERELKLAKIISCYLNERIRLKNCSKCHGVCPAAFMSTCRVPVAIVPIPATLDSIELQEVPQVLN